MKFSLKSTSLFIIFSLILFSCEDNDDSYPFNSEWKNLPLTKKTIRDGDNNIVMQEVYNWVGNKATILYTGFGLENDTTAVYEYNEYGLITKADLYDTGYGKIAYSYTVQYMDIWKRVKSIVSYPDDSDKDYVVNYVWDGLQYTDDRYNKTVTVNEYGKAISQSDFPRTIYYKSDNRRIDKIVYYNANGCDEYVETAYNWDKNIGTYYSDPNFPIDCDNPQYANKTVYEFNADFLITKIINYETLGNGEYGDVVQTQTWEYDESKPFKNIKD